MSYRKLCLRLLLKFSCEGTIVYSFLDALRLVIGLVIKKMQIAVATTIFCVVPRYTPLRHRRSCSPV